MNLEPTALSVCHSIEQFLKLGPAVKAWYVQVVGKNQSGGGPKPPTVSKNILSLPRCTVSIRQTGREKKEILYKRAAWETSDVRKMDIKFNRK